MGAEEDRARGRRGRAIQTRGAASAREGQRPRVLDQGRAEARERQLIECELAVTRRTGRALRFLVASGIMLCFLATAVLTWMAVS